MPGHHRPAGADPGREDDRELIGGPSFAENALRRELKRLQRAENKGKRFPKRESELRGGRPIGS